MPRKCVVIGCQTNRDFYEPGVRFFPFPRDDDEPMQQKWKVAIGRDPSWKITYFAGVCQKHFSPTEITSDRRLGEKIFPTLDLPSNRETTGEKEEKYSSDSSEPPKVKRHKAKPLKHRSETVKQEQPAPVEIVLETSYEKPVVGHCRMCSTELDSTSGFNISTIRTTKAVREAIWDMCYIDCVDASVEEALTQICNSCWEKMLTFESFVGKCNKKQLALFKMYRKRLNEAPSQKAEEDNGEAEWLVKDEPIDFDAEHGFEQVIIPENNADESNSKETAEPFPSLEGLSIDEMIDVLDKLPVNRKISSNTTDQECWDCGQMFPNISRKKEHRKTCSAIGTPESLRNRSYTCEICNKQINTRSGYRVHLKKIHKDHSTSEENCPQELKRLQSRKRLQCPLCPDRFQQVYQLKYHLKTHKVKTMCAKKKKEEWPKGPDGRDVCQVCGKSFNHPTYMERHMKFHLKQKDFNCDQCDKRFYLKQDLRHHQKTVHEEHTFLCTECGKSFGTKRSLLRHAQSHDTSSNTFHCSYCPKSLLTAYALKYHEMKHTGEREYRCEMCGHEFRFRYMLTQHKMRVHNIEIEGTKLYKRSRKEPPNDRAEQVYGDCEMAGDDLIEFNDGEEDSFPEDENSEVNDNN